MLELAAWYLLSMRAASEDGSVHAVIVGLSLGDVLDANQSLVCRSARAFSDPSTRPCIGGGEGDNRSVCLAAVAGWCTVVSDRGIGCCSVRLGGRWMLCASERLGGRRVPSASERVGGRWIWGMAGGAGNRPASAW
eukprot:648731-Rhodomonas_salina.1